MSGGLRLLSNHHLSLLKLLWKWKLMSTSAVSKKVWPDNKVSSSYSRLIELKNKKFITIKTTDWEDCHLWSLDRGGFSAIRDFLPELREVGYGSEHRIHDWLTSSFHLGDWLINAPAEVSFFSEQELRRFHPEHYPTWAPNESSHRPDGYWHSDVGADRRTVALEMEINRKLPSDYQRVGSFYGDHLKIDRVLWVVDSLASAENILKNLENAPGARSKIYSFVLIHSFLKNGWQALIEYGSGKGLNVTSFLSKALALPNCANPVKTLYDCTAFALLETRKKGLESVTSETRRELSFS